MTDHINDHLAHCRHAGHASMQIAEKTRHLNQIEQGTGAARLSELTADGLEHHLQAMKESGLSARTINFSRQIAVAFMNWCKHTGRIESNPLTIVGKQDESKDRRRIRRSLTDIELWRLIAVAESRGRKAWYVTAVLAGLRKSELQKLT